ncbi:MULTISPECIES: Sec-independent protein translocase protein TatB [Thermomonas]|jgi:sec-independent protein translocase protein TatB|uniref:Sec-independent protein translocase protein TatB n=1 Tax=Thermomonas beijingensis TaxID=2872701 RepID=A0ABS7TGD7_9GAMM|nr:MULTISPECIES: Sec-independent protein translocase protein TatB [Thermomonas]MDE2381912.1 twin-arginine translocase subunit TatB [Xanthomonadaceae bacterium]MBZ4186929.1 Sec-independent protein translocase protein TatB [Thermomonas beijingensis]HOC12144.1 Sec-independent protein translocase protein TatB [Thermomonas sp.]HQA02190.1 Sec-independent protein translocase protein TatB [Thermomonas sp.]HQE08321.1 Sec-independent protein translocase protein TatB [Thermomonas sp.]
MFDFSLGEMLVVALVALVVLGPERLPKAARFAGLWVRRARAQWHSVRTELEQELASEELKRSLQEGRQVLVDTRSQLQDSLHDAHSHLQELSEHTGEAGIEHMHVPASTGPATRTDTGKYDD